LSILSPEKDGQRATWFFATDINPSGLGPIEVHISFDLIEEKREVFAGIGPFPVFGTFLISKWTKSNRDISSDFSGRRAPTPMKFDSD
jgi:hypothetical protein